MLAQDLAICSTDQESRAFNAFQPIVYENAMSWIQFYSESEWVLIANVQSSLSTMNTIKKKKKRTQIFVIQV